MSTDLLAVVEQKRFLGREFLTWLVHRIEEGDRHVAHAGQVTELALGDRVVLAGGADGKARVTIADTGDARAEIGAGLRRGKLVDKARLVLTRGERRWELTLDGGMLVYEGLRCPALGDRDAGLQADPRAAFENDLFLRIADAEDALAVLDALFAEFCACRGTSAWSERDVPALREWVERLGEG
ncbi:MAG TPA: hypothetical protein VFD84_04635 [Candidatus Binatia bacterium]|nr:hypothetical protein [Candidatus Binatia bacterium]